jgi:homoserine kinase type II
MTQDNAEGGQRGLRARPSPELIETLQRNYGMACGAEILDLGGSSSLNLLLTSAHGRFVARVYRPYVSAGRLEAIQMVRRTLAAHGLPCAPLVASRQGRPWVRLGGRLLEVEEYVDHNGQMNTFERLATGLPLLGRVHSVLREIDAGDGARTPLFANSIGAPEALPRTIRGVRRIRGWEPTAEERQIADAAEALARRVTSAERDLVPLLPRQLVHGDYWDNNVLFQDERIVLIADLEFMGERARIDDLALTLFYYACDVSSSAEPIADDVIASIRQPLDAYDSGLEYHLSVQERKALPLAMARQPLWSIGGWVAMLDDVERARAHAAATGPEVTMALGILDELDRWQAALT